MPIRKLLVMAGWGLLISASVGRAQTLRPWASNVVIPQSRAFAIDQPIVVDITAVDVEVSIRGQMATTVMDIHMWNPGNRRLESELLLPVPEGAMIRAFAFEGEGDGATARLLPRDEARSVYDRLVAKIRDPALLEFLGYRLVRSSIFPVEARGRQRVRLIYEQLLESDGHRIDYRLPRSESVDYRVPWNITVGLVADRAISTIYSPSHPLTTERNGPGSITARLAPGAEMEPGAFCLSCLFETEEVSGSFFAYPASEQAGGSFLLLAGAPAPRAERKPIPREVILVLDRSGSMSGEKIEQVRQAALQIISGLEDGERFNLIVYNDAVDMLAASPVRRTRSSLQEARRYLERTHARGGTNIHDALVTALQQPSSAGALPLVLFLTDGLPTMGETSEAAIRAAVRSANREGRRIFTFGVGVDVNTALLDRIASQTRARATYVLRGEDVERKVSTQFKQLAGPILTDLTIEVERGRVSELMPARLPDLYEGDQLVLLGRYTGNQPIGFALTGHREGQSHTHHYRLDPDRAEIRNAFVPRLWASRKIASLVAAIRDLGAARDPVGSSAAIARDPRFRELVNEVVHLSTEFGILTEYTAFLAEEGSDLSDPGEVLARAGSNFLGRAIATRSGRGAVGQSLNGQAQISQKVLNLRNHLVFLDAPNDLPPRPVQGNIRPQRTGRSDGIEDVTFTSVRQVHDRALFRKGRQWIDSRILGHEGELDSLVTLEFGSEAFQRFALRLAEEGRQGLVALRGDLLLEIDGRPVLVKAPETVSR